MSEHVLDKGIDYLQEIQAKLEQVKQMEESIQATNADIKKLEKQVKQQEKEKKDTISSTIKKRKIELESTFDKEMDVVRGKMKKIDQKRENDKSKQQDARYHEQTGHYREEMEACMIEIRNILKQDHISGFCKTDLYYRLFLPKGIYDVFILFVWLLVTLVAIPSLICVVGNATFLRDVTSKTVYYILIFVCCISVVFIAYLIISSRTKLRHRDALLRCRNEKQKIRSIKKQMRAVRNKIEKDKDESGYNLDSFDEQLSALRSEQEMIGSKKMEALKQFEEQKRPVIEQEISERYDAVISECQQKQADAEQLVSTTQKELGDLRITISEQYETYLGKEYVNLEVVQELVEIMQDSQIPTIKEAIESYEAIGN